MAEVNRTKNISGKSHDQRSAGTNTELFGFHVWRPCTLFSGQFILTLTGNSLASYVSGRVKKPKNFEDFFSFADFLFSLIFVSFFFSLR